MNRDGLVAGIAVVCLSACGTICEASPTATVTTETMHDGQTALLSHNAQWHGDAVFRVRTEDDPVAQEECQLTAPFFSWFISAHDGVAVDPRFTSITSYTTATVDGEPNWGNVYSLTGSVLWRETSDDPDAHPRGSIFAHAPGWTLATPKIVRDPEDIWYFGGCDAANYSEQSVMTITGLPAGGNISWAASIPNRFVFVVGGERVPSVNGAATSVTIESAGRSLTPYDVSLNVCYNDLQVANAPLTVHCPGKFSGGVMDGPYVSGNGHGFIVHYTFAVCDWATGDAVPRPLEIHEEFGAWQKDYADSDWKVPQPNGVFTGRSGPPAEFHDNYGYSDGSRTPPPVPPPDATKVQHCVQSYWAGDTSATASPPGVMFRAHSLQYCCGDAYQY